MIFPGIVVLCGNSQKYQRLRAFFRIAIVELASVFTKKTSCFSTYEDVYET